MALPEGLGYFKISWRAIIGIADSVDPDDEPDIITASGSVVFTPSRRSLTLLGSDAASLFLDPVVGIVGADGIMRNPAGGTLISLISPFSPGLQEKGWEWQASFSLGDYKKDSFPFQGNPGDVLNLANLAPVKVEKTTITISGPPGPQGPAGSEGPAGPQGPIGASAAQGYFTAPSIEDNYLSVGVVSNWGIDSQGNPYWDPAGAAVNEAAVLTVDPTGSLILVKPH